jgi:predicted transcriptional regulator
MSEDLIAIGERAQILVESDQDLLERLIALRVKHHIPQAEVARRMGVTQPTVSNFERYDSNPRLSTIRRYALAVDALVHHEVIDDCARHVEFESVVSTSSPTWSESVVAYSNWGPGKRVTNVLDDVYV